MEDDQSQDLPLASQRDNGRVPVWVWVQRQEKTSVPAWRQAERALFLTGSLLPYSDFLVFPGHQWKLMRYLFCHQTKTLGLPPVVESWLLSRLAYPYLAALGLVHVSGIVLILFSCQSGDWAPQPLQTLSFVPCRTSCSSLPLNCHSSGLQLICLAGW